MIITLSENEVIVRVINFALELFVNALSGNFHTNSTDDLINNHLFIPDMKNIVFGDNTFIAADCTLHGPLDIGNEVAINHHCILDGGRVGIKLHDQVRIAAYCHLYAFDHGMDLEQPIYQQPVRSQGIEIGRDVWLGAHVGIKDGIKIADQAVVGMNSMVTKNVEERAIVAGNPAQFIRYRE